MGRECLTLSSHAFSVRLRTLPKWKLCAWKDKCNWISFSTLANWCFEGEGFILWNKHEKNQLKTENTVFTHQSFPDLQRGAWSLTLFRNVALFHLYFILTHKKIFLLLHKLAHIQPPYSSVLQYLLHNVLTENISVPIRPVVTSVRHDHMGTSESL